MSKLEFEQTVTLELLRKFPTTSSFEVRRMVEAAQDASSRLYSDDCSDLESLVDTIEEHRDGLLAVIGKIRNALDNVVCIGDSPVSNIMAILDEAKPLLVEADDGQG